MQAVSKAQNEQTVIAFRATTLNLTCNSLIISKGGFKTRHFGRFRVKRGMTGF
ncbi:MAG: hypothetical protein LBD45_01860 [Bacteroidales bacterium]|jgi:hypothetical protein|nr:hypothetical protein [Bacteroidales bacterium]